MDGGARRVDGGTARRWLRLEIDPCEYMLALDLIGLSCSAAVLQWPNVFVSA